MSASTPILTASSARAAPANTTMDATQSARAAIFQAIGIQPLRFFDRRLDAGWLVQERQCAARQERPQAPARAGPPALSSAVGSGERGQTHRRRDRRDGFREAAPPIL